MNAVQINRYFRKTMAHIHFIGDEHALGILERQRVKLWLKNAYSEIDTLHV
ncbi:MAG: hypothetical protein Q8K12_11195 [Thiobacillus sp.]|nr:hypothetical protein [Thiobacillus sp.]